MENEKSKNIIIGAGLGMVFGAAFGSAAVGLVIGAAVAAVSGSCIRNKLASRA
ncbi:MAG: hypothetical protein R3283_09920 [Balneolaceae bacterium]|nr:hypothetical protein [Balneolaceae bacterium]